MSDPSGVQGAFGRTASRRSIASTPRRSTSTGACTTLAWIGFEPLDHSRRRMQVWLLGDPEQLARGPEWFRELDMFLAEDRPTGWRGASCTSGSG
jgi:hypothetical protein